jgi:hypothetical protein
MLANGTSKGSKNRLSHQFYHGKAITENDTHLQNDKKNAVWTTFFRKFRQMLIPKHSLWYDRCHYKQSLVDPRNKYSYKNYLPPADVDVIKPVYRDMARNELLKKCPCKTQNCNESLHSLIQGKCLKTRFVGKQSVTTEIMDDKRVLNDGQVTLHQTL